MIAWDSSSPVRFRRAALDACESDDRFEPGSLAPVPSFVRWGVFFHWKPLVPSKIRDR
jgi:hypothetical protein